MLEPLPNSPCGQVADEQIVAAYVDLRAIGELGARSDVVTYEFENIPLEAVTSLEHDRRVWGLTDTITPSAINSWIGEEVKVVGAEGTITHDFDGGRLAATGGVFGYDDTSGTLLSFRGWALHDRLQRSRHQPDAGRLQLPGRRGTSLRDCQHHASRSRPG